MALPFWFGGSSKAEPPNGGDSSGRSRRLRARDTLELVQNTTPGTEVETGPVSAAQALDRERIEQIRQGDERALEALYSCYHRQLHAFARSVVRSDETAEECIHDVFVSLWNRRAALEIRDVKTYLFRSVRLRAIDSLRSADAVHRADREALARNILHASDARTDDADATDQLTLITEIRDAVYQAIASMPEARATAARLRWIDDLTIAEIANVMGISVPAAQMHVSRSRAAVADVLERFLEPEG